MTTTHASTELRYSSPMEAGGRTLPTHGPLVCAWIEANCVLGEGDYYGQPIRLRRWQQRFIHRLYEYYPETGRRRYKRALLGVGKGNGKSPLAAGIGAYELAGGVNPSPRVIIGAASLKQANVVFGDLRSMVVGTDDTPSPLRPLVEPFDLQILLKEPMRGLAERIAAESGTNDGARATAFIADELHEWTGRKGRVFLVVEGAIAKRISGFTLSISTAGVIGPRDSDGTPDSVLERMYEHGRRVAEGLEEDDAFLFEWYEAPPGLSLENPDEWEQAVRAANPAYGDFLDPDHLKYRFRTLPRYEFERYHLNRWTASLNRWLPLEEWDACSGEPEIPEQSEVYVGVDPSYKRDLTAIAIVHRDEEGMLHAKVEVYAAPEGEWMDFDRIENRLREIARTYYVRDFLFDATPFSQSAQRLHEEGLPMTEVPQSPARKKLYSQALYDAVVNRRLRHGGDHVLREHADAAVAQDRGNGWTLEKQKASRHIDAIVALAMAVEAASEEEGEPGIEIIDF